MEEVNSDHPVFMGFTLEQGLALTLNETSLLYINETWQWRLPLSRLPFTYNAQNSLEVLHSSNGFPDHNFCGVAVKSTKGHGSTDQRREFCSSQPTNCNAIRGSRSSLRVCTSRLYELRASDIFTHVGLLCEVWGNVRKINR